MTLPVRTRIRKITPSDADVKLWAAAKLVVLEVKAVHLICLPSSYSCTMDARPGTPRRTVPSKLGILPSPRSV